MCTTVGGLLVVLVGGGASVTLGGVYLCVLPDAVGLCAVVGGGVVLLPWVVFDCCERGGVDCCGDSGCAWDGAVCCGG